MERLASSVPIRYLSVKTEAMLQSLAARGSLMVAMVDADSGRCLWFGGSVPCIVRSNDGLDCSAACAAHNQEEEHYCLFAMKLTLGQSILVR